MRRSLLLRYLGARGPAHHCPCPVLSQQAAAEEARASAALPCPHLPPPASPRPPGPPAPAAPPRACACCPSSQRARWWRGACGAWRSSACLWSCRAAARCVGRRRSGGGGRRRWPCCPGRAAAAVLIVGLVGGQLGCCTVHCRDALQSVRAALYARAQVGLAHISELLDEGKVNNIHGLFRQDQAVRAKVGRGTGASAAVYVHGAAAACRHRASHGAPCVSQAFSGLLPRPVQPHGGKRSDCPAARVQVLSIDLGAGRMSLSLKPSAVGADEDGGPARSKRQRRGPVDLDDEMADAEEEEGEEDEEDALVASSSGSGSEDEDEGMEEGGTSSEGSEEGSDAGEDDGRWGAVERPGVRSLLAFACVHAARHAKHAAGASWLTSALPRALCPSWQMLVWMT